MVPKPASHGPVASNPHRDLKCTLSLWSSTGRHLDLVTLVPTWASPVSGDSGPHLDFTWIWCLWSTPGPLLDLVTPFQHGRHVDLVTLVLSLASPDLVSLVHTLT